MLKYSSLVVVGGYWTTHAVASSCCYCCCCCWALYARWRGEKEKVVVVVEEVLFADCEANDEAQDDDQCHTHADDYQNLFLDLREK